MATGTKIDSLYASFGADFKELLSEMKKAEAATAKFRGTVHKELSQANQILDKFGNVARAAALGFVSAFSTAKIGQAVRSTLEWADNTGTLAERLNLSTDALQELIFAGREMNVTADEMAKGLQSFWAKVSEAATGKGEGLTVLRQLGIDPASLRSADDALTQIASKIKQFDRASQLTVAKTFFGDEKAAQFLGLMLGDLESAKQKARELGVVVDAELIAKGTALNKEFEKVADVGIAKMRKEILGIVVDVQTLVSMIGNLGPEFDKLAEGLKRSFLFLPALQEIFRARDEARRDAEGQAALNRMGDERLKALAGPQRPTGGTRRLDLNTGAASAAAAAMESFEKQIERARIAALALRHELNFGKAAAENAKALEAFANAAGKFQPTADQVQRFSRALKETEAAKTALAFKDMAVENERLVQIVAAEVAGNRELVAVLEERFRIEDRLGRGLTEVEAARAAGLARVRFKIEENRREAQQMWEEIRSFVGSGLGDLSSALFQFGNTNETVWERIRNVAVRALEQIAQKIFELGVMNQIMNSLFQGTPGFQPLPTLFGFASKLIGGLGGAGGFDISGISGFAEGGRPPVGVPSIVGEKGPEVFVPDVAGTIMPNRMMGGGTTILIDARGSDDPAAVEAAAYRAVIKASPHLVNASVNKVRDTAWRDPNYLPR